MQDHVNDLYLETFAINNKNKLKVFWNRIKVYNENSVAKIIKNSDKYKKVNPIENNYETSVYVDGCLIGLKKLKQGP